MLNDTQISQWKESLQEDAGSPVFVELAESLREEGKVLEALEVCLKGLSVNESNDLGRLLLAKLYYELEAPPFALKELKELNQRGVGGDSLRKLISAIGGEAVFNENVEETTQANVETVAEAEFEFDDLDFSDEDSDR